MRNEQHYRKSMTNKSSKSTQNLFMQSLERQLTSENIGEILMNYQQKISDIGTNISGVVGLPLLRKIKRELVETGPYANVTLFEAANRIMTDLVILNGVKWLLEKTNIPMSSYTVQYGNETSNFHDLEAEHENIRLVGESFNVAPSLFQTKKSATLKKLRKTKADYHLILINDDAVKESYCPRKLYGSELMIFVDIFCGCCQLFPANRRRELIKDQITNTHR